MLAWQGASLLVAGETWNLASFLNLTSENAFSSYTDTHGALIGHGANWGGGPGVQC